MSNNQIIELRNLLELEAQKSTKNSGSFDNFNFIKKFKTNNEEAVRKAVNDLVDIALRTLLADVRKRKKHSSWTEPQRLLFDDMPGIRTSIPVKSANGRKITKTIPSLTFQEFEDWLLKDKSTQVSRWNLIRHLRSC